MKKIFVVLITLMISLPLFAEDFAVVVNSAAGGDNGKNAFLLNHESWGNGTAVEPYELDKAGGLKNVLITKAFAKSFLGMGMSDYKGHWANRKASGKTKKPTLVKDFNAMKRFVERKAGAIGYLPKAMVTGKMKVIANFSN